MPAKGQDAMANSYFLARLIGPLLVVLGVGMLADTRGYRDMVDEFLHSRALIYIAGLFALIAGLAIVLTHNVWTADWRVVITLLGWLGIAGGIVRIMLPQRVIAIGNWIFARHAAITAHAVVVVALGAWLSFVGYFA